MEGKKPIAAILPRGSRGEVMEAAREAGAERGTTLSAEALGYTRLTSSSASQ
jgi:hypothetical protein